MKYSLPTTCIYCQQLLLPCDDGHYKTCNKHNAEVYFSNNGAKITIIYNNIQLDYYEFYKHSILYHNQKFIIVFPDNQLIFDLNPDEIIQHVQRYIDIAVFL